MTRNVVVRTLFVLVGAMVALGAILPVPAAAVGTAVIERDGEPIMITLNGRTTVEGGEVADDVWVANGRATVNGRVEGSVVILNGGAAISGSVGGDVIVVRGDAWIGPEAVVRGDVRASNPVTVSDGAVVAGDVRQVSVFSGLVSLASELRLAMWIGLTVAVLGLGLLTLRPGRAVVDRARGRLGDRPFGSVAGGLAVLAGLTLLALLALVTIVGGLLAVLLLAVAALAAVAGLVVIAAALGHWILPRRSAVVQLVTGVALLRLVALVPYLGPLLTVGAALAGTGALLAAARARVTTATPEAEVDVDLADRPTGVAAEPADLADRPTGVAEERVGLAAESAGLADREPPHGEPAQPAPVVGSGVNLDLRPGHEAPGVADEPAGEPAGVGAAEPGWLDSLLGGADREAAAEADEAEQPAPPVIDLRGEEPVVEAARPAIIASLPVREDHFADDPRGPVGNGARRDLFADAPRRPATVGGVPLFAEAGDAPPDRPEGSTGPSSTTAGAETGEAGYDGPLFAPPDPTRLPRERDRLFADAPVDTEDVELDPGRLFSGGRAWRPGQN